MSLIKKPALIIFFLITASCVNSQSKLNLSNTCNYYGEKTPSSVYTFMSDNEAAAALKLITEASGLASNFKILASDIPNAAAAIINNQRYILYNQTFINNLNQRVNYWASISILAHEVGHHLNGHSLLPGGSRPGLELEADKFSGFILAKLGATLDEAQSAINALVTEKSSITHPGKSTRLAATANGWYSNKSSVNSEKTFEKPSFIGQKDGKIYMPYYIKRDTITSPPYNYYKPRSFEVYFEDYLFNKIPWSEYSLVDPGKNLVLYFYEQQRYLYVPNHERDPIGVKIPLEMIDAWSNPSPYCYIKTSEKTFSVYNKGKTVKAVKASKSPSGYSLDITLEDGTVLWGRLEDFKNIGTGIPVPLNK
jgi:hypothetical protein